MKRKASVLSLVLCVMALLVSACGENGNAGGPVTGESSRESVVAVQNSNKDGEPDVSSGAEAGSQLTGEESESHEEGGEYADASFDGSGEGGAEAGSMDGEYSLEYKLSYGYRDETEGRYVYHLDGRVTVNGEESFNDSDWYNNSRPVVYAMFFPDLFGESVCQLYLDFALYDFGSEIYVNLPYDSPNGTFDNDTAIQYDEVGAIDNGGSIRVNFPITVSGMGTDTLTISDGIDDFTYVFTLQK